jgi:hypothetical protein
LHRDVSGILRGFLLEGRVDSAGESIAPGLSATDANAAPIEVEGQPAFLERRMASKLVTWVDTPPSEDALYPYLLLVVEPGRVLVFKN